ncbi:MAG: hypothetical protein ACREPH_10805 [Rhodanobacteraceae bacterium]
MATNLARGYLLQNVDNDPVGALAEFKRASELAPNNSRAMTFLTYGLATVGQLQPAADLFRKDIDTDPLEDGQHASLASILVVQHKLADAERTFRKALALQPDYPGLYANLAQIDILRGDATAAQPDAQQETDPVMGAWIRALVQQIGPDHKQADAALRAYIAKYGETQPYYVADLYALRKQLDDMFEWLDRALAQHDPAIFSLLFDPFPLAYRDDPRFAALCRKAGLPLPQPVATAGR